MHGGLMTGKLPDAENLGLVTGVTRRRHQYHPEPDTPGTQYRPGPSPQSSRRDCHRLAEVALGTCRPARAMPCHTVGVSCGVANSAGCTAQVASVAITDLEQ